MAEYRKADQIDTAPLTQAEAKARRSRNVALAFVLVAIVGVFYWSTVVKFGPALQDRPIISLAPDRSRADPDFKPVAPKEPMPGQPSLAAPGSGSGATSNAPATAQPEASQ